MRCSFETVKTTEGMLVIRDADGMTSVTNQADQVVRHFNDLGMGVRRLYYYDTDGKLDELEHDGKGKFLGFKTLTDEERAEVEAV